MIVQVHTYKRHPKYFKSYRTTKKFHAHDENNICKEGDEVTIVTPGGEKVFEIDRVDYI